MEKGFRSLMYEECERVLKKWTHGAELHMWEKILPSCEPPLATVTKGQVGPPTLMELLLSAL